MISSLLGMLYLAGLYCIFPNNIAISIIFSHKNVILGKLVYMGNSLTLTVETSGRTGSAAIGTGEIILAERFLSGQLRHAAELFTCCQSILKHIGHKACEINQIYISAGPGSFTGLRIAVTMAKMFAFASNTKIVAISTMDVISENATEFSKATGQQMEQVAVILDAKRSQFFVAVYQKSESGWTKIVDDCLMTSSEFRQRFDGGKKNIWLLGEGLVYYKDDFKGDQIDIVPEEYWYPNAHNAYIIGRKKALANQFTDPESLTPFYLRKTEATEKWEQKQKNHKSE